MATFGPTGELNGCTLTDVSIEDQEGGVSEVVPGAPLGVGVYELEPLGVGVCELEPGERLRVEVFRLEPGISLGGGE